MSVTAHPTARALASVKTLIAVKIVDPYWKRHAPKVEELLDRALGEMAAWSSGDEPIAALQRASGWLLVALELALDGQSPPTVLAPETPENADRNRPHRNSRPKRRYAAEGAPA
jgi:hypothetical protein